jgi:adenylate cyclase
MNISIENLSRRERMIAERYAQGETYKEVANFLSIAPSTVRTHLISIYRKLGISSKVSLNSVLSKSSAANLDAVKTATGKPSIAILPFTNLSSDEKENYFVEGFTEELLLGLGRFREITVIARQSSFVIELENLKSNESAARLGVQYILEGSVRRDENRVLITVKLIDGGTGYQIWSDRYDRILDDVFEVQDEVAMRVVTMLIGNIERSDHECSMSKETRNLSAYECVLRGKYLLKDWRGSKDDVRHARDMFEQAIELDPRYSTAYAGLAATYIDDFYHGWSDTPEITGARSIELAHQAIKLDEQNCFAHFVLSNGYWLVKADFELAKNQLEIAIELNPNYYWNYCYGSWLSVCAGDLDISIERGNEAMRRNPMLPDGCLWILGIAQYLSQHYDKAITAINQMTKLETENYACLAACNAQLGRVEQTKLAVAKFSNQNDNDAMSTADWCTYWRGFLDFKDQAPVDHLIDGMDKAGLVSR